MELNTVSVADMTDLVSREWNIFNDMVTVGPAQSLYITEDIPNFTGNTRRYTDIDTRTYANEKGESEDAAKQSVQQGYTVTMTMRRFAAEIDISWEMRRLNKVPEVVSQLTSLSHFCPQRLELDATHRIGFMTATSYVDLDGQTVTTTVGDGLALVSAVHTLRGTATTFSNVITGNPAFSRGGLEVAEAQVNTQILSQYGERRVMKFNTIVTGDDPTTVNNVKQFLKSVTDVDQNNPSVVNVYLGKYQHIVLPYIATTAAGAYDSTKAAYWALVATGQGVRGWQAYIAVWERPNLKTPSPGNNGEDIHSDDWTYGTRCSYGIATVSPRGFIASTGLGA